MQIVKDGRLAEDSWLHLDDEAAVPAGGDVTLSFARWRKEGAALNGRDGRLGVRLDGGDPLEELGPLAQQFPLLVVEFPVMTDGRGFSIARLLRDQYGFQGELRARGHFLRDQVFFLQRVGCNAFESSLIDAEALLPGLGDFTVRYQASQDEPLPLYRRR